MLYIVHTNYSTNMDNPNNYNWKKVNIASADKIKLDQLVEYYTTATSKGVRSTILSNMINDEYYKVFKK